MTHVALHGALQASQPRLRGEKERPLARDFLRLASLRCTTATRLHHPRSSILRALRVMRLWAVRWTRSNDEALIFLAIIYDRNLSLNFLFYDRNQCVISNILVWEPLILSSEQMEDNLGNQSLT